MLASRALLTVELCLLATLSGCLTPNYHQRPGGAMAAIDNDSKAEQGETLIRVDHEGNVYRGDEASAQAASVAVEGKSTRESARRTTAKREQVPAEFAAADKNTSFDELAAEIDEPRVDAARVAELVAAHERRAPPASEPPQQAAAPIFEWPAVEQSPSTSLAPTTAPAEAKAVSLPAGVFPTVVRTTRFDLEYDDQVLGEGGIAKVELYGTRDAGRTWERLGEDADRRSPYAVEMPEAGVFGFRIAVAGKNGLASRPPKNGELPELWVRVDLSEPMFRANLRPAGEAAAHGEPQPPEASSSDQVVASAVAPSNTSKIEQSPPSEVAPATHIEEVQAAVASPDDWKSRLAQAIVAAETLLQSHENAPPGGLDDKSRLSAHLRMMYLAAERHEDAIKSSAHDDTAQNEFWSHQMHGLKLLVEPTTTPAARQAAAALAEFREASDKLAATSELQVKSLMFCTAAHSFGVYETTIAGSTWKHNDYAQRKFEPEQPIVLYFEIANFASEQTTSREFPDGAWRTSLRGSYTVVDSSGSPVEQRELKLKDDVCRNRRHDYYVAYKSWIPKLNPGQYSLELLVEDTIAGKIGTSSIDFEVVAQ